MNLFEEYCKRHGLRCPVIKRAENRLNVIFRADPAIWLTHWMVFQISVHQESYHPAFYHFSWLLPQHNGIFGSGALQNLSAPLRVDWDNYDIEIIKAAQREDGIAAIADLSEAKMAAWEIFLYCADERIYGLPPTVRYKIYESLSHEKSIEERMKCQQAIVDFLYKSGDGLAGRWDNIRVYCDPAKYASWLADLAERMRDQEYRKEFSDLQSVA